MKRILILALFIIPAMTRGDFFKLADDVVFIPRQMSLGGSGAALTDDHAQFFNPGALTIYDRYGFNLTYYRMGISGHDMILGNVNIPFNSKNLIALELSDFSLDEKGLSYGENKFGVTYNRRLFDYLSLGGRVYYLRQTGSDDSEGSAVLPKSVTGSGFGFDLGAVYNPITDLKIGLSLQRLGGLKLSYNDIQNRKVADFGWIFGLSYRWDRFLFLTDFSDRFQQGIEYEGIKGLDIRAGYYKSFKGDKEFRMTFGFGLSFDQLEFDYAYIGHDYLPSLHLFTLSASLIKESKMLEIRNSSVEPIYTAFYQHYSQYPPAYATIKNNSAEKIKFRAGIKIKDLMDDYSKTADWSELPPNGFTQVKIPVIIPVKNANVNENFNTQAEFMVEFNSGGKNYQVKEDKKVRVYGNRFLTWDQPEKLASFVNPMDSTVMKFTKMLIKKDYPVSYWEGVNGALKNAGLIYSGLQLYGIKYAKDPNVPDISQQNDQLDYIQFPGETFRFKSGDCDDLVVLFASCLESIGVNTAFISVPGHILLAFDTNLKPEEYQDLTLDKNQVIMAKDRVWVPLEITLIGEHDLKSAWNAGVRVFMRNKKKLDFIPLKEAWRTFPPTASYSNSITFKIHERYFKKIWKRNMNVARNSLLKEVDEYYKNKKQREDYRYHNDVGVTLARMGFLSKAKNQFLLAVRNNPGYAHSYSNLANYYMRVNDYDKAVAYFMKAFRIEPRDGELCLNIAIAYALKGDRRNGLAYLRKAVSLNPKMKEEYEKQYKAYHP